MDDQIYVFKFSPMDNPPSRDMLYQVYTSEPMLMNRFLRQHNFVNGGDYVEIANPKDIDIDITQELEIFHFGSNLRRNKMYDIVTSQQLVDEAVRHLGNKLSSSSLFNSLIIEHNIPLMEKISECIDRLPYGYVLNIVSEDEFEQMEKRVDLQYKKINDSPAEYYISDPDSPDDSLIYETLFEESRVSDIQPATMEQYIETFVSLITDEYK